MALPFPGSTGCVSSSRPVVKAGKEAVEGVWQCTICGAGGCEAVLVAGEGLYLLPHAYGTVAVEVLLYALLVPAFGLIDASPQASPCLFSGLQVPILKCRVPCPCLAIWLGSSSTVSVLETVSAQKLMYERTAEVCPSRSVP